MKIVAMVPARMGSQRLKRKNLAEIDGLPLVAHALRKCLKSGRFESVWLNSEDQAFEEIALSEGASFHHRPAHLGDNQATSEQFVAEFLSNHECDYVVQVHSIAPLLPQARISAFVDMLVNTKPDTLLSVVDENLECMHNGQPVNFRFDQKTNSQDLDPVRRIVWAITAWKRSTYLTAFEAGQCATYAGRVELFPIDRFEGHVIKVQQDLDVARALHPVLAQD